MNRDEFAALVRAIISVALGAGVLLGLGALFGWWAPAALVVGCTAYSVWWLLQLPRNWRPW